MRIINAGFEILSKIEGADILKNIEIAGRTCYKSEDNITADSAEKFMAMLIKRGHEAMIEHVSLSVKIICDRGVTHEIVRHRLASYAQESTRYCNYGAEKFGGQITVIEPLFFAKDSEEYRLWEYAMSEAERYYLYLIHRGVSAQEARSVLPNSLKTEIVVTMNLREWRHFFKLRTSAAAHPQMREISRPMLKRFQELIPIVFDDIAYE